MDRHRQAQTLRAKRAEARRPFLGSNVLASPDLRQDLRERAELALRDFAELAAKGIAFNPFLEIGAGSGHRSAALASHYGAEGVASDISESALRNMPYVLLALDLDREPTRICCDACHLPFVEDTFQFVFCYRTLHHFENPVPIVAECFRVLGRGGHLFFNEEPMDSPLKRLLRRDRQLAHPPTRLQRLARRVGIDRLLWDDAAYEISVGITEARFDMAVWREALRPFSAVEVEISRRLRLRSDLYRPRVAAWLSASWGGNVRALCRKEEGHPAPAAFGERLMCVDCGCPGLARNEAQGRRCPACGRDYRRQHDILRMLPRELEAVLPGDGTA